MPLFFALRLVTLIPLVTSSTCRELFHIHESPAVSGSVISWTESLCGQYRAAPIDIRHSCALSQLYCTCTAISFSLLSFSMRNLHFISSLICSATCWEVWPSMPCTTHTTQPRPLGPGTHLGDLELVQLAVEVTVHIVPDQVAALPALSLIHI